MSKTFSDRLIESRSIDYVPIAERHGKVWHLWPVWFSGDAHLATVATGAVGLALGGHLLWMAIAVTLGCAMGTFFMAFHSTQGPQLGLPQMIQSRPQFGFMGALLVWCVALLAYIGFNAFNQLLAAQTVQSLYGGAAAPAMLVFAAISVALAVVGYDLIHVAQRWVAYVLIAALLVFSVAVATHWQLYARVGSLGPFQTVPFLAQFFAAASYQISWSIYVSDYSRYLPRDVGVRASFWWTFLGAMIGGAWMMLVGMVVAACAPKLDIAAAAVAAGNAIAPHFGIVLLVFSLGGLVTITSLNLYGASLTMLSVADSFRPLRPTAVKRVVTLVLSASIATGLALMASGDFVNRFGDLLAILLYLFTPWTAINLVDFYVVRRGHYSVRQIFSPNGMYGRWNWRGLSAYAGGFLAMVPFFSTGLYVGPVARALDGADVAMVVGLPVSAAIYLLACRSMDVAADRRLAAESDIGLDPAS
jgi:purine-cytosine permease-like protein